MPTVTLTSFNCHWGLSPDRTPFDVARTCAAFDSDVLAVQEVWNPHGGNRSLAAVAGEHGYHLVEATQAGSFLDPRPEITRDPHLATGTWGIALLSRLPVLAVRTVELGRAIGRWDVARRVALVADLQVGTTTIVVAVVHLSHVLPNAVLQLARLGGALGRTHPTVIAGDCNLWGPLASTLARRRRAVRGRTWPAHRPHSQLDHLLVADGRDVAVRVASAAVLPPAGSDHRPVRAELTLLPR